MTQRSQPDDPMKALLRHGLKQAATAQGCPSPDLLAAYFERTLSSTESARWESHFSSCLHCQEQLAALARIESSVSLPALEAQRGSFFLLNWRWLTPAVAALGAVVLWVAINPPTPQAPMKTVAATPNPAEQPLIAQKPPADAPRSEEQLRAKVGESQNGKLGNLSSKTVPTVLADAVKLPAAPPPRLPETSAAASALGRTAKVDATTPQRTAGLADASYEKRKNKAFADARDQIAARADAPSTTRESAAKEKEREKDLGGPAGEKKEALPTAASTVVVESAATTTQTKPNIQTAEAKADTQANVQELSLDQQRLRKAQSVPAQRQSQNEVGGTMRAQEAPPKQLEEGARGLIGQARPAPKPHIVAASPSGRIQWRFFTEAQIERYDERLQSGEMVKSPVPQDLLAASAPSEKVCWAVGRMGVIILTVDGKRWARIGSPSEEDLASVEARDDRNATVRTASGKAYATTDGGRTWRTP